MLIAQTKILQLQTLLIRQSADIIGQPMLQVCVVNFGLHDGTSPFKKLLFMGSEYGQFIEWNENASLDWHLVEQYEKHTQMQKYSAELNKFYCENAALWQVDFDWNGFQWIDCNDNDNSVVSFIRKAKDESDYIIAICNFTPEVRVGYRIGVPDKGAYEEVIQGPLCA